MHYPLNHIQWRKKLTRYIFNSLILFSSIPLWAGPLKWVYSEFYCIIIIRPSWYSRKPESL